MSILYQEYSPEDRLKLRKVLLEILKDFIAFCQRHNLSYIVDGGTLIGTVRHKGFIPWDDDIDVAMPRRDYEIFLDVFQKEMKGPYRLVNPRINRGYISNVTKLERLETRTITAQGTAIGYDFCISLDIFPLDKTGPDRFHAKKQLITTWIINKLIFLRGSSNPIISLSGFAGSAARTVFRMTHWVLKTLHVSPAFLYGLLERESRRYNGSRSDCYTIFNSPTAARETISASELFPLREKSFEGVTVMVPNQYDAYLRRVYGNYMELPPEDERVNHDLLMIDFGES